MGVSGMISVIVPIYNSEKYIAACLDSILAQTYKELEIILVDDGSTDGSMRICKDYALKDNRIRMIHQENGGSTKARKTGLEAAQGEYISFVDSDDWIEDCFYETLYALLLENDADIVASGCLKEYEDKKIDLPNCFEEGVYKGQDLQEKIYPQMMYYKEGGFFSWGILPYLWNKLFKREVIEPCIYQMDFRIYDGEDVACVFDACLRADSIYIDNHAYYHYRIHANSICTMERGEQYFMNAFRLYKYMKTLFSNKGNNEILLEQLAHFMKMFIHNGTGDAFGYRLKKLTDDWCLPKKLLNKRVSVCIYGAGNVGVSFYSQLIKQSEVEVVGWVDSSAHGKKIGLVPIDKPETIFDKKWDYVLIAVFNEQMAKEITEWLKEHGVEEECILWEQPKRVPLEIEVLNK